MIRRFLPLILAVLFSQTLVAQRVEPAILSFEVVPGNVSPQEGIAFTNTGQTELALEISATSPFMLSENRCAKGVKPNSHCNVYLTYSAQTVGEQDSGTLTISYSGGSLTIPLSGEGVEAIGTWMTLTRGRGQCWKPKVGLGIGVEAKVGTMDKFYAPPAGEIVSGSCTNGTSTASMGQQTLALCIKGRCPSGPYAEASMGFTPDEVGLWTCTAFYGGDGILGESENSTTFDVVDSGEHCP